MIKTQNIQYSYSKEVTLSFPDISCASGEALLLLGKSGVGKTTLLHLLAGLLSPEAGEVIIEGQSLSDLSNSKRDKFRGQHIGLVLQQSYFVSSLSVIDNIVLASWVVSKNKATQLAEELLNELGLLEYKNHCPNELSAGQQQRISLARALINNPKVILADEPTAALDDESAQEVIHLLLRFSEKYNAALVIVTHDSRLKEVVPNQIKLS